MDVALWVGAGQGRRDGRGRGPDRVPADLEHRAPDPRRLAARLHRRQEQGVRHRDPDRRDRRGDHRLLAAAARHGGRPARSERAGAALRAQRGDRLRAGGGARPAVRQGDQGAPVHARRWWPRAFIVGGFVILWAERRSVGRAHRLGRRHDAAGRAQGRPGAVPGDDPRHQPLRRHHHRRHAARPVAQGRHRLQLLPRHPDADRRRRLQPVQGARAAVDGRPAAVRRRAAVLVRLAPGSACAGCCATSPATPSCRSPGTASPSASWCWSPRRWAG